MTNTATEYYEKVQNSSVAQMVITQAEHLVSFSEIVTEIVLPTDGNCKEDMEDLEAHEEIKGAINRTKRVTRRMARRGKKKLMKYKSVKLSVDAVSTRGKYIFAEPFHCHVSLQIKQKNYELGSETTWTPPLESTRRELSFEWSHL